MTKKGCIYTCLIGQYDSLLFPSVVDSEYDYICYTDQPQLLRRSKVGPWIIRPLLYTELDSTRNQRWHKIIGYQSLDEYDYSIYIDNNVNIYTDKIYKLGKSTEKTFIVPIHHIRHCIYEEITFCSTNKKDDKNICDTVREMLVKEGMPHGYGLTENNLIFRRHNHKEIDILMNEWWEYISHFSKRDQLSLCFILWKKGINIKDITIQNIRIDKENFRLYPHINIFTPISYFKAIICDSYRPYQPFMTLIRICQKLPRRIINYVI